MTYTRKAAESSSPAREEATHKVVSPKFTDQRSSTQTQLKQQDLIHSTPQTSVQRVMASQSSAPIQGAGMEEEALQAKVIAQREEMEEEPVQGKFVTQRADEEEEPLQGKFTAQLAGTEEEEPLQGKFEPLQRASLEEEEPAQAQPANQTGLPNQLKSGIENLSGYSMNDVKVYYNSSKPAQLQAHAFAQGSDIHVAPGQEQHLPHEAWHVVQQKQGRVKPTLQLQGHSVNDDAGLEQEADTMGAKALSANPSTSQRKSSKPTEVDTQSTAQRKLIYYKNTTETKLDNFAAVIDAFRGKKSADEVKATIINAINTKFSGAESEDRFNPLMMDQFIDAHDGYLNTGTGAELTDSLYEFYKDCLDKFVKKAGDIESSKSYTDLKDIYDDTEGDDGLNVGSDYDQGLACTLFALLAVKGSYLGASTPEELHNIFQSISKFKAYDEDANVGLIRMQAGLHYSTTYKGKTVKQMVDSLGEGERGRKFIIDMDGEAHTFALKYVDGWKRFDNGSSQGYKTGAEIGGYSSKKISVTWE